MKIYLVRHGESQANADKSLHFTTADHAIHLSERGKKQAAFAGQILEKELTTTALMPPTPQTEDIEHFFQRFFGPKRIRMWVSPYQRTRETAAIIEKEIGKLDNVDISVKENIHLVEQQFGLFDGLEHDEVELQKQFPIEYAHYKKQLTQEGKFWARMPMGESRFDVALRVHQAFGTFHRDFQKHGIDTLIIVAHGLSIRAFIMQWLHLPVEWFERSHNPNNCSIQVIDGKNLSCLCEGDKYENNN